MTTHIGLLDAIQRVTPERVHTVIRLAHDTLVRAGIARPRIGNCGINPHAGENGLFGYGEEERLIEPGVRRAVAEGIDVSGPLPADTLFFRVARGDFDIVVAMDHDQPQIKVTETHPFTLTAYRWCRNKNARNVAVSFGPLGSL